MVGDAAPAWTYSNDGRILTMFLGATMVILGVGLLLVFLWGVQAAEPADLFLAIGVFLLIFTVLLFVPRLRTRGAFSYSLLVQAPMGLAEAAVRGAIEATGRTVQVQITESRILRPARTILIDGLPPRFLLKAAPHRERREEGTSWTEIIQVGLLDEGDEVAKELRERVAAAFAVPARAGE